MQQPWQWKAAAIVPGRKDLVCRECCSLPGNEKSASNYTRLNELMKEKTEKEAQLEEKMDRWMYLTDLVEQIESQK